MNNWGAAQQAAVLKVLAVRYEDVQNDPSHEVMRLFSHFKIDIPLDVIQNVIPDASKSAMEKAVDPKGSEQILRKSSDDLSSYFNGGNDKFFRETVTNNLRFPYGYDYETIGLSS